jgi:hypothetical protein
MAPLGRLRHCRMVLNHLRLYKLILKFTVFRTVVYTASEEPFELFVRALYAMSFIIREPDVVYR